MEGEKKFIVASLTKYVALTAVPPPEYPSHTSRMA